MIRMEELQMPPEVSIGGDGNNGAQYKNEQKRSWTLGTTGQYGTQNRTGLSF